MSRLFNLWILIFCLQCQTVICQDTLDNKTFYELDDLSVKAFWAGDIELSRVYSSYQIAMAKRQKDSVRIAYSFYTYMFSEDTEFALQYCDSAIAYTLNSGHNSHPTYGYLVKSRRLIESHRFDEAMNNLVIAYEYAKRKKNISHISSVKQKMAIIKSYLGNYQEALNLYREDYQYTIKFDYTSDRENNLEVATYNLSIIFLKNRMLDSARFYSKLGLKTSDFESNWYYTFVGINAQVDYYSGIYGSAFDSLTKYENKYKGNSLANKFYYIGKIYDKRNDMEMAEMYFRRVDSIVVADQEPFMEAKDVYQTLAEYYKKKKNDSIQIAFINKYIWTDSILNYQKAQINPLMELKFDNPRMLEERERLLNRAKSKNKWIYVFLLFVFVLLLTVTSLYLSHKKLKGKLKILMEKGVAPETIKVENETNVKLIVPQNIVSEIRKKLDQFEKSHLVNDPSLNQTILANKMVTNSTYLSNYINYFKGKNFPSYLKELRIKIAVDRLKKEPNLLKYSIKGLALEFGFATPSAFSRAFIRHTGIKPSQFLNELIKN